MLEQPQDKTKSWWFRGIAIALFLVFLILWVPEWLVPKSILDAKTRAELVIANRDTLFKGLQTVAGLAFIATAVFTWRNLNLTEDKNVTDRFSKAVEMLADDKLEIRLGGIYLLERIASKDSKENHPVVMEVLTAFIREKAIQPKKAIDDPFSSSKLQDDQDSEISAISQDIQSTLTVIGRRKVARDLQHLNLSGAFLSNVILNDAVLSGANFVQVNLSTGLLISVDLSNTFLVGADLNKTYFDRVNLNNAKLNGANLINTTFNYAKLNETVLSGADLSNAAFYETELVKAVLFRTILLGAVLPAANLTKADLRHANLREAKLIKANLRGAALSGADLRGADLIGSDLSDAYLIGAKPGLLHSK
ncbi:MAG: pentapeptide repeat-containing protein [Thainema sp.]